MKKKLFTLLMCGTVFGLAACGSQKTEESSDTASAPQEAEEAPEAEAEADGKEDTDTQEAEETAEPAADIDLTILYEADDDMINNYSLLAVNPDAPFVDENETEITDVAINQTGAEALINWMLSADAEKLASEYGVEEYGDSLFTLKEGAPVSEQEIPEATEETKTIRMSTTTSVNDSGLLGAILPVFEETYGYQVEVFSAGTGKAIANAKAGNADVIMVHAKAQEEA